MDVSAWRRFLADSMSPAAEWRAIRAATYRGRPLGSREFVAGLEKQLGRRLEARAGGRPRQGAESEKGQLALWSSD
jgi:hypothetical protein